MKGCRQTRVGSGFSGSISYFGWPADDGGVQLGLVRERLQRGERDVVPVHLEEGAQLPAIVRAAEAVGAQHLVAAGNEGRICSANDFM